MSFNKWIKKLYYYSYNNEKNVVQAVFSVIPPNKSKIYQILKYKTCNKAEQM